MKNLLLILGFVFLFQTGQKHERILKLDISASQIEPDASGNFYVVEGNKISMYSPAGELEYSYSNYFTTKLHNIDVSNPDKTLLFYRQDQKITLLNQYFRTEPEPFFLQEKGYENITAACLSTDDNVWVFDEKQQVLIKLTDAGEFITRGKSLGESLDETADPSFMAASRDRIYLSDPRLGILVFDAIGNYLETLPLKGVVHFRPDNGKLFFVTGKQARIYNLNTGKETSVEMPHNRYKTATFDVRGKNMILYLADPNKLDILEMPFVEN